MTSEHLGSSQAVQAYMPVANAIAQAVGPMCEVALHDFADPGRSLVYMAGHVTGRALGAPATNLLLRELARDHHAVKDLLNYHTTAPNGRQLRCSSIFIRDDDHVLVGAMCINIDVSAFQAVAEIANTILNHDTADTDSPVNGDTQPEAFSDNVESFLDEAIQRTVKSKGKHPPSFDLQQRLSIVDELESQGIFQIRGAVARLAYHLSLSKYTIYSYRQDLKHATTPEDRNKDFRSGEST